MTWAPPVNADPMYYGRLPFAEAQAHFAQGVVDHTRTVVSECGWHHTNFDVETGAFAIVQGGGALEPFVGGVVAITPTSTRQARTLYAYVHQTADMDEQISITRRYFLALSLLSVTSVRVRVAPVLAP